MHIVIIGNGITGITAALTIRKLEPEFRLTVISSESARFFSRTALMYAFMGQIKYQHLFPYEEWFWQENRLELVQAFVTELRPYEKKIMLKEGKILSYDKLLLATGSVPATYGWPGQELPGVQGFYSLQDLGRLEKHSVTCKKAVIVGGGLIGAELAEMLHSRHIPVTLLVREPHFWGNILPPEEGQLIGDHIKSFGIDVRLGTELQEITGSAASGVTGVRTSTGEQISCDLVCLATGAEPNTALLRNSSIETDAGVLVNRYFETSQPDVFAAGDCARFREPGENNPAVEQLWYTGRMQGETAAYNLCGRKTAYRRGVVFNSAKFFQIELQTYGLVPGQLPENQETLFWQHPEKKKSLRINYKKNTGEITGLSLLGIRFRHDVCEKWLSRKTNIRQVLSELHQANFDPEFHTRYEHYLVALFNNRYPQNSVAVNKKKRRFGLFL